VSNTIYTSGRSTAFIATFGSNRPTSYGSRQLYKQAKTGFKQHFIPKLIAPWPFAWKALINGKS